MHMPTGSGFSGTLLTGKEHNDEFYVDKDGNTRTITNRSGGIQGGFSVYSPPLSSPLTFLFLTFSRDTSSGGISNGENIIIRVAFKPTSTIGQEQSTVSRDGAEMKIRGKGRHDPCVLPRAVPMVEAMVALTILDALMQVLFSSPLLKLVLILSSFSLGCLFT
jgi:chorismate synthase